MKNSIKMVEEYKVGDRFIEQDKNNSLVYEIDRIIPCFKENGETYVLRVLNKSGGIAMHNKEYLDKFLTKIIK